MSEPINLKREAAQRWAGTLMRRMESSVIKDTNIHWAKVKPSGTAGVPMFAVTSKSGIVDAECALNQEVYAWAYDQLVKGQELPNLEPEAIEPCHAVYGLLRINRVKDLLRLRAKDWGRNVKAVPTATVARLTHEIDAAITRAAMAL